MRSFRIYVDNGEAKDVDDLASPKWLVQAADSWRAFEQVVENHAYDLQALDVEKLLAHDTANDLWFEGVIRVQPSVERVSPTNRRDVMGECYEAPESSDPETA